MNHVEFESKALQAGIHVPLDARSFFVSPGTVRSESLKSKDLTVPGPLPGGAWIPACKTLVKPKQSKFQFLNLFLILLSPDG